VNVNLLFMGKEIQERLFFFLNEKTQGVSFSFI
jgi:hypothetical protein